MLGWEFPPFMSGGLGTAVDGLTQSLVSQGHEVVFVLPHPIPEGHVSHVELVGPRILAQRAAALRAGQLSRQTIPAGVPSVPAFEADLPVSLSVQESVIYRKIMTQLETFKATAPSSYPGVDAGDVLRRVVETIQEQRETVTHTTQLPGSIVSKSDTEQFASVAESSADELATVIESVLDSLGEMGTGSGG